MIQIYQYFIDVLCQVVPHRKTAHGFETQIPNVGPRAADEDDQYFGDVDGQFFIEGLVVVNYHVDDLE